MNILTADIENNLRFPGQYYDAEIGLHYNWNRYYDPETGRYIAADPIGLSGGMNLYAYVGSDPVNGVDFEGLHKGDKWYGYNNQDFHKWFHRCWKEPGNPDADKEEIEEAYEEWVRNGKPKGGKCGGSPLSEPESQEICGKTCKKVVVGITATGALIIKYICTGGPFNPVYN